MTIICPACESREINDLLNIKEYPVFLSPVPEDLKNNVIKRKLTALTCKKCRHIFLDNTNAKETSIIYDNYYKYYPYDNLETMNTPYRIPFEEIFHKMFKEINNTENENIRLLEIGCSSGAQLKFFNNYNIDVCGIDPSASDNSEQENIIRAKYGEHNFNHGFDIIVSRFNLEHMDNIEKFFTQVKSDLNDNGLFFIQVPNIQSYLESGLTLYVAHEHVHYFNPYSLYEAVKKHRLRLADAIYKDSQSIIFAVSNVKGGDPTYSEILFEKLKNPDFLDLNDYLNKLNNLKDTIKPLLENSNPKYFYGAGLNLVWILYQSGLNCKNIQYIIDDNRILEDRYMPDTDLKVKPLEEIEFLPDSEVWLTLNPVYFNQVIPKIKKNKNVTKIYNVNTNGIKCAI